MALRVPRLFPRFHTKTKLRNTRHQLQSTTSRLPHGRTFSSLEAQSSLHAGPFSSSSRLRRSCFPRTLTIHIRTMYKRLAEIPIPTSAQFVQDDATQSVVQVNYSVKDHAQKTKRVLTKSIFLPSGGAEAQAHPIAGPLTEYGLVAQSISPSKQLRATWRNASDKRIVEIWKGSRLIVSMDVTESHGEFYADDYLSTFSWAASEQAVVYTAEAKPPSDSKDYFQRFRFTPDFGEGLTGKKRPTTFILRWEEASSSTAGSTEAEVKATLSEVKIDPTNASVGGEPVRFGQAVFSPLSEDVLYATGYEFTTDGCLLGVKGCYNRPTGIWRIRLVPNPSPAKTSDNIKSTIISIEANATKLTPSDLSCRSPRTFKASQNQATLVWLGSATGGAHIATSSLHSLDISSDSDGSQSAAAGLAGKSLVPVVRTPLGDGFPGLYPPYNLPPQPLLQSAQYLVLHSEWGCQTVPLLVSLKDGSVKLIGEEDPEPFSWSVLGTDGRNKVLCTRSSPATPYEILLGTVSDSGDVQWKHIDSPDLADDVKEVLSTVKAKVIPIPIPNRGEIETIVIQSSRDEKPGTLPPCVTSPHGGPHGATTTTFSPTTTALVLEGYTFSFPNYTGSTGRGDAFIQDLIGRCGTYDLEECIATAKHLVKLGISEEGPGKQMVTGGSHGGFLTAHLIGSYPDFFSAAILRNPVISCPEVSSTDIPDWYFSEFGLPYPHPSLPPSNSGSENQTTIPPILTSEAFDVLQAASPTRNLDKIYIPVLLMMGAADRRVAGTHGFLLYHALKARYATRARGTGVEPPKVEMLVFEGEGHPLDGVEASMVNFEATRDWFGAVRR